MDKLEPTLKEKKETPTVLLAGSLVGGKDVPEGRYKVVAASGKGSNFIVRSSTGKSKANTIIGNPPLGVKEYVLTIEQGDALECHASFKFIPIQ